MNRSYTVFVTNISQFYFREQSCHILHPRFDHVTNIPIFLLIVLKYRKQIISSLYFLFSFLIMEINSFKSFNTLSSYPEVHDSSYGSIFIFIYCSFVFSCTSLWWSEGGAFMLDTVVILLTVIFEQISTIFVTICWVLVINRLNTLRIIILSFLESAH